MLFGTISPAAAPRRSFLPSILLHGALIGVLALVRFSAPATAIQNHMLTFTAVVPPERPPTAEPPPQPKPKRFALPAVLPKLAVPAIRPPEAAIVPELPKAAISPPASLPAPLPPRPAQRAEVFAPATPAPAAKPPQAVVSEAFHAAVSLPRTEPRPAAVRESGFGTAEARHNSRPADTTIAAAHFGEVAASPDRAERRAPVVQSDGAFASAKAATSQVATPRVTRTEAGFGAAVAATTEQPARKSGARTALDAGFGSAAAAPAQTAAPKSAVRTGGFDPVAQAAPQKTRAVATPPTDVQILFKPRPVYTDEARKLKIEGEVQLEVVFAASGEVKVLRVIKGLGHGLDEAATHAAAGIRFKPAQQDGHAVSSTAVARITFQLAY